MEVLGKLDDQAWASEWLGLLPLFMDLQDEEGILLQRSSFMGRRVEGGYEREGKAGAQVTMVTQVEHMQGNSPGLRNCICGRGTCKTVAGINNMGS